MKAGCRWLGACALWILGGQAVLAQQSSAPYTFEWEVVATDAIPGMTTVRLYAKLVHPTDYLTSVSGWADMEGRIETTTSFYQDPDGWVTPSNNNPLLFGILPSLEFDSWVTIGIASAPDGAAGEIPIGVFPPESGFWVEDFEAGGDLVMDVDGAWFVTLGSENGVAGEDLRVLVGQFTTDGVITGVLNLQVFSEGQASNDFMDDVHSILIPEFDANPALRVDEPSVGIGTWMAVSREGGYRHRVQKGCRWERLDMTGRLLESGRTSDGRFQTAGGGVIRLWPDGGGMPRSRWWP